MGTALEVKAISATSSAPTGVRQLRTVSKLIDTTTCIGCKACEVACQEWNDLQIEPTTNFGSYQTLPDLTPNFWNLIRFNEVERDGKLVWLMRKDQCMHCEDAGCLKACPAPGAIVQYENGIVDFVQENCIGCGYCITGCPFNIPRLHEKTHRVHKCTLCVDRVEAGLEPACIKACPTGCLQFGTWDDMKTVAEKRVEQLKAAGFQQAAVYGDNLPGVGGRTGVLYVLAYGDRPEDYGLPKDPKIPTSVYIWKTFFKPVGWLLMGLSIFGAFFHYMRYGPKEVKEEDEQ